MTMGILPGDSLWYRDAWGIPARMIVDWYWNGMVRGMSDRGSFVAAPVNCFCKTLESLEARVSGRLTPRAA